LKRIGSEISFVEMHEDVYLKNRVRVQMDQLNLVMIEQVAKEVASRKAKSALKKGLWDYNLIGVRRRDVFILSRPPFEDSMGWKEMFID
jgi:hypothetical protein